MSGRQDFFADLARTVHVSQWQLALFLAAAATECVAFQNPPTALVSWMLALLHSKIHGSHLVVLECIGCADHFAESVQVRHKLTMVTT